MVLDYAKSSEGSVVELIYFNGRLTFMFGSAGEKRRMCSKNISSSLETTYKLK